MDARRRAFLLSRLHLHGVLPALEELAEESAAARELIRGWDFSIRLQVARGPAATLTSRDGHLHVAAEQDGQPKAPASIVLAFLTPGQLNKMFLNQRALPPLPIAGFWRAGRLRPFVALTKLLDGALQPPDLAVALGDGDFRLLHYRLLFRVLLGSLPAVAEGDPIAVQTLATTPPGLAEIRADAISRRGWVAWDGRRVTAGTGAAPRAPDVIISFRDETVAGTALLGKLDAAAAVGKGEIEVTGLVPLADSLSVVMDRVEIYLQPASPSGPA